MIEKQMHQKFGFIKIKQLEKVKVKQQLLTKMKKQHKLLSTGTMVRFFLFTLFQIICLLFDQIDKEVLSSIVKISLATRRASAFGGRGGFRGGRGGFRGRGRCR